MIGSALAWLAGRVVLGRTLKAWWPVIAAVAVAALIAFLKLRWTADGVQREREAQAERNRRTKVIADEARDQALRSDDPRRELLDEFGRPDGQ